MQPLASSQTSSPSQHTGSLAAPGISQGSATQQRRLQSDSQSDGRASSSGGAHAGLLAETQAANRALSEDAAPGQAAVCLTAGVPAGASGGAGDRGHGGPTTVPGGGEKGLVDRHIVATQAAAQAQVCKILQSPRLFEGGNSSVGRGAEHPVFPRAAPRSVANGNNSIARLINFDCCNSWLEFSIFLYSGRLPIIMLVYLETRAWQETQANHSSAKADSC